MSKTNKVSNQVDCTQKLNNQVKDLLLMCLVKFCVNNKRIEISVEHLLSFIHFPLESFLSNNLGPISIIAYLCKTTHKNTRETSKLYTTGTRRTLESNPGHSCCRACVLTTEPKLNLQAQCWTLDSVDKYRSLDYVCST